jgi:bifunctional non-homologous end joining protein LigD
MALEEYRKKRNFKETPEPPPGREKPRRPGRGPIFVVQKHEATRLHYDFRLEIGGVLVSWAVPKGPSLNPADKRLAIQTEDHPLEYADFEGVIPEGHYGAGIVMVWDKGTYEIEPDGSAAEQLAAGELKFTLHGQKLNGGFVLIRAGLRSSGARQGKNWLLIKRQDEYADRSWNIDRYDRSVLTGRTLEEIAAAAV